MAVKDDVLLHFIQDFSRAASCPIHAQGARRAGCGAGRPPLAQRGALPAEGSIREHDAGSSARERARGTGFPTGRTSGSAPFRHAPDFRAEACVSGLPHHRQRSGQPLRKTSVRIPGPSWTEKCWILVTTPVTSFSARAGLIVHRSMAYHASWEVRAMRSFWRSRLKSTK